MANWIEQDITDVVKDVNAGRADKLKALMEKAGSCMLDELTDALNKEDPRNGSGGYRHQIQQEDSGKEIHTIRSSGAYYNWLPVVSLPLDQCKK